MAGLIPKSMSKEIQKVRLNPISGELVVAKGDKILGLVRSESFSSERNAIANVML